MKLCYIVYREETVMVYASQVLEYLQCMKSFEEIEEIELIVFRHEKNWNKKQEVEQRILKYVGKCKTFATAPIMSVAQLDFSVSQLKRYIRKRYADNDQLAVICRGDLAAYVGIKAFKDRKNSRVLFDNRGLAYEESVMSYGNNLIFKINREVKRKAMFYAKEHCDLYNFVTLRMRYYMLERYEYRQDIPYTIIPTLYQSEHVSDREMEEWEQKFCFKDHSFIVSYIGAVQAWQSADQFVNLIKKIADTHPEARFVFLMKGSMPGYEALSEELKKKIYITAVPHEQVKYYLKKSSLGIVLRNDDIVNQVAAPTKIAEYLTNGINLLYSGEIGIIEDIKPMVDPGSLIRLDANDEWLEKIGECKKKNASKQIQKYFGYKERQRETLDLFIDSFQRERMESYCNG